LPFPRRLSERRTAEAESIDIALDEAQPLVQRRVQLPGEVSLAVMDEVVQALQRLAWRPLTSPV
jgi:hypothetical protein